MRKTRLSHFSSYRRFIKSIQEVDGRFVDYFIALIFLHFTELMKHGQDNSKTVEVNDELNQFNESTSIGLETKSRSSSKAANIMMKLKTKINTNTMVQVELAKAFLRMSMNNADVDQVQPDCSARVYLAYLYYSTFTLTNCL